MQQAKRLMRAAINRHDRFQTIVADMGIDNPQMRHHGVIAGGIQLVER